jgi:hypothetical protein
MMPKQPQSLRRRQSRHQNQRRRWRQWKIAMVLVSQAQEKKERETKLWTKMNSLLRHPKKANRIQVQLRKKRTRRVRRARRIQTRR